MQNVAPRPSFTYGIMPAAYSVELALGFVLSNLRLAELVAIVKINKAFYDDFMIYLGEMGYKTSQDFVNEKSDEKAKAVIAGFLGRTSKAELLDGGGKPYRNSQARWYFLAWILRDAPAQRLAPLLGKIKGANPEARKTHLLNEVRKFVAPLFPDFESWTWPAISEVMLARLEGSRRALKGSLFEGIVRHCLVTVFKEYGIRLSVGDKEVRIHDETYDVQVSGPNRSILIPVKTRETMGGGHAMLFTRDIHKSISVAEDHGYTCLPIVIAESWGGDLKSLRSQNFIYIQVNPNQVDKIKPLLIQRLRELKPLFKDLAKR